MCVSLDLLGRHLLDPEHPAIEVVETVGNDDFRSETLNGAVHHARRAADDASLQGDQSWGIAHQGPLPGVLGERAPQADPCRFLRSQGMAKDIGGLTGHLAPQTRPFAAHYHHWFGLLLFRVVLAQTAAVLCLLDAHYFVSVVRLGLAGRSATPLLPHRFPLLVRLFALLT